MLNAVLDAVTKTLVSAGVNAFREFPDRDLPSSGGTFVCVGSDECICRSPGFGDYLGVRTDLLSGAVTELFGKRLEVTLCLEVFSPYDPSFGEKACALCADKVTEILDGLPSGLRVIQITREGVTADEELSLFRCVCSLRCLAFFIAEKSEERTEFLDFIMKGAIGSANQ
jgi:hypothetical protein